MSKYEAVIGLEVHVQLSTESKAFCGCSTAFGLSPNSSTCPVCLGLPGVLPVLNEEAFNRAIKVALALDCEIQKKVKFDRKNYYYPDLPKNYQISQYDMPLAYNGFLDIGVEGKRRIQIKRVHMEEDAGKLIHDQKKKVSYVDLNRTGIPLLEIVSEPELYTPEEAHDYLIRLKAVLLYLNVSDCNMEEGRLRCDANISLRKKGDKGLGVKVEIKNMNSFKAVRAALQYEIDRQAEALLDGTKIMQETRLWDSTKLLTIIMRTKEEAHDYRYFPEPDLVPFIVDTARIEEIRKLLPELPRERKKRLVASYRLSEKEADVIIMDKKNADYFEDVVKLYNAPKIVSNWLTTEIMGEINQRNTTIDKLEFGPSKLAELLKLIDDGTISGKMAKGLFRECIETGVSPKELAAKSGLKQISGEKELDSIIDEVIEENNKPVNDYKEGKANALMFLVGQIMKRTRGKANPNVVNELLKNKLNKM